MQHFQMQRLKNYEHMMMNVQFVGYAWFSSLIVYHSVFSWFPNLLGKYQEPMAKAKKLHCSHLFHLACLRSWYGSCYLLNPGFSFIFILEHVMPYRK